jgi:hypothetical protein
VAAPCFLLRRFFLPMPRASFTSAGWSNNSTGS